MNTLNQNIKEVVIKDSTWKQIQGYKVAWDATGHRLISLSVMRTKKGFYSGTARIEKTKKK